MEFLKSLTSLLTNKSALKALAASLVGEAAEKEIKKRLAFSSELKAALKDEGLTELQIARIEPKINGAHADEVNEWIAAKINKL